MPSISVWQEMLRAFPQISPLDLEEIMEWLDDEGYLNPDGLSFRREFWKELIEKKDKK